MKSPLAKKSSSDRSQAIDRFLATQGWGEAVRVPLAGDASFRRYERIKMGDKTAVLMDAPPAKEDVRPFEKVAAYLVSLGYSAPCLLAAEESTGLLLLEDLGDDLYTRVLLAHPDQEEALYQVATEVLIDLYHKARPAGIKLPVYDTALLMQEASLLSDWFLPQIMQADEVEVRAAEYKTLWQELLEQAGLTQDMLVLRDYHADNLMWLPERQGVKRAGLLDFQDAVIGSPAYDLVSFLEDARRDVQPETVQLVLDQYLKATGLPRDPFLKEYAVLGAQRNCKIVGIFTRLAVRDGKHGYLKFLPRVWRHLENDVAHPMLAPLQAWLDRYVAPAWRGEITIQPVHATA